ncbi:MAG: substrate-binding domain-containing protein [Oscillospiraceae bacterium]|jgi:ABC-type sugar transport system substrate-binding protein|nr:substrate-binding domain-containing protein [Oscillospiraceae bacterium]
MKKLISLLLAVMMLLALGTAAHADAAEMSETVKGLYEAFDKAMTEQLGEVPADSGAVKVGAVIISLTNPFWANMKECYEAAGEELGIQVDVQTGTTEGDTASQLDVLMTMADMDYDVIIVSPIDGTNLIPGIVKCNENGVKVINLGPGVDLKALEEAGGHLDAKITVNFNEQGDTVAKDMMNRLPDGGQVAVIAGLAGAGQSEGRTQGFVDAVSADSNYELVAVQNCDWDATLAFDAAKALITEYPELKGIFCCNDVMALAVIEALAAEDKTDVLVYGVDFTNDARDAIAEGSMTGSMSYSSQRYTKAALQMAILLKAGHEFDSFVYLPLTLVNVDNVADLEGWR